MSDWRFHKEPAALLADCAANPPALVVRTYRFNETAELYDPQDSRVRRLKELREAREPEIDTIEWRAWLSCDEQDAIRSAITTKAIGEAA